ncbi:diguanylate cyclase with PAS/PAC sensor [Pseudidiomarina maritima]|jgi:diguanylate cyclase (GGDEF)-like protein/PAS domain S-box-containing protein|uniref:Diguanylate cyclase with PAS/PAC sensor n=1 Tax=Pseudidiomarina maritima TaxID=519453 RepID=A0A1I6G655_9GAMM|nr:sensor domain-containing diguanylate cyclase [Pseudidiomarina maritima]SFR37683.1 diguanylate cyclase with PAS/PAC sensor [Pseudidiomarina maritima]
MPHPKLAQFKALGQYLDLLLDAICVVNSNGEFIYVSGGGERVFGYKPEEMIGHSMFKFMHPEDHDKTRAVVAEIMQGIAKINVENRYIRKNGDVAHILWSARYSKEDDFRIAVARDVTEQRQAESERLQLLQRLEQQALYDPLTELPNRAYFYQRALQVLQRRSEVALLYLDLNKFKEINDSFGHAIGDRVLKVAAQRITESLRTNDMVARIGGDEFVVLLERIQSVTDAKHIAEKIVHAFQNPIEVNAGQPFNVGISIGIALSKDCGRELEQLLLKADNAMYQAKLMTDNRIKVAADDK